ncbi:MAG TPA: mechanosensitive ion channel domain-containing protein [Pyrinomonadaceae bacterium]|nr:mechanosensitive ion channel domain-containing protein [Pyrinomonadaceae bacterium]
MSTLWYAIVIVGLFYIGWRAFVLNAPTIKEQRQAKYHYARAGIFVAVGQLIFMFVLNVNGLPIGSLLPTVCFLTWSATALIILINSEISKTIQRLTAVVVIGTPMLLLLYAGGVQGFLRDIDAFSAVITRGVVSAAEKKPDTPPASTQTTGNDAVSHSSDNQAKDRPDKVTIPETPAASQVRISHILKGLFFFINAFLLTHYLGKMWYFSYQARTKLAAKTGLEADAADQIVMVLSIAFSLWLAFVLLGFDTLSISVFSGLIVIGASVALKDLLSNFVSGALLLWLKSIRVGDVISIDRSRVGRVVGITMRYLIVEDRNDIEYLIPYSQLANAIVENWSKGKKQVRLKLDIGVAYDSTIEQVKDIMSSVCFEVPRVLKSPLPVPLIVGMGDSAIQFQLRFRIADPENGIRNVMSDVYERLLKRFESAQIEIPYPQREFRVRPVRAENKPKNPLDRGFFIENRSNQNGTRRTKKPL